MDLAAFLVEGFDGLVVGKPRERQLARFEFGYIALEGLQFRAPPGKHALDHERHQLLGQRADIVEMREGDLRLDHPELCQVAARLGFLGAERRPKAVALADGGRGRLVV